MVKIKRGNHETLVSMGSYETIFKPLGYTLAVSNKVEEPKEEPAKAVSDKRKKIQED